MKLVINNIVSNGLSGGYKKYIKNVTPYISADNRVKECTLIVPSGHKDLLIDNRVRTIVMPNYKGFKRNAWIKDKLIGIKADAIFVPTARGFRLGKTPVITMVRNMEPLITPFKNNPFNEKIVNLIRIMIAYCACVNAVRIIAVSKFVKSFLEEKWNFPSDKIGVVYHGIDENVQGAKSFLNTNSDLKYSFIFTAGSIRPARGLEDAISALSILEKYHDVKLLIAGKIDPRMEQYSKYLKDKIEKYGLKNQVIWKGHLNEEEMAWHYQNCKAFIMTSRAEACPNIAMEAMKYGCITVASKNPPLPEFFSGNAFYYQPNNVLQLASQIKKALSLKEIERKRIAVNGMRNIRRFTWEICAKRTIDEIEKAVSVNHLRK